MRVLKFIAYCLAATPVGLSATHTYSHNTSAASIPITSTKEASGPKLAETQDFIMKNLPPGSDEIKKSIKGVTAEASCTEIKITINYHAVRDSLVLSFVPTKVQYSLADPKISGRVFRIECVKERCIRRQVYAGQDPEKLQTYVMMTSVEPSRMVKALQHHQYLCGGKDESPF